MKWLRQILRTDVPHIKMDVGQEVYINGVKYIIVGINVDMRGHADIQTEVADQYRRNRMVGHE